MARDLPNGKFHSRLARTVCAMHSNLQTGTGLTIGAEPGTRRKQLSGTQFSVWIFRVGILEYLPSHSVNFGHFSVGQTKITLLFTIQPKFSDFFFGGKHSTIFHERALDEINLITNRREWPFF